MAWIWPELEPNPKSFRYTLKKRRPIPITSHELVKLQGIGWSETMLAPLPGCARAPSFGSCHGNAHA